MSLIKCYKCSDTMSDKAKKCPHCKATAPRECYECQQLISKKVSVCPLCGAPKIKKSILEAPSILRPSVWGILSFAFILYALFTSAFYNFILFFTFVSLSVVTGIIGLKYKPNFLAKIGLILGLMILILSCLSVATGIAIYGD